MAIYQQQEQPPSLLDALYCEEEHWEVDEEEDENEEQDTIFRSPDIRSRDSNITHCLLPILLLEQDLFWEDEELITLFSKEQRQGISEQSIFDISLSSARKEAVEWMLMVNTHFGFSTLTSVLAVNYLDRFLSGFNLQKDKPWTMQLAAVTCLSLAAKVEETYVPLLVDLQVDETKYMFEAKNIQKMELLVLSSLEWKMHPVTPLSFLDHIIRRLGLKNHLHWEFLRQCERVLLSILPDWRFVGYVPSVLAAATMMHVIDQIEASNPLDYQNQLLGVLKISKEKVNNCYQLMKEISSPSTAENKYNGNMNGSSKRKWEQMINASTNNNSQSSPSGVIDHASLYLSSCDSSNDSWAVTATTTACTDENNCNGNNSSIGLLSSSSSLSSSPVSKSVNWKRGKIQEQALQIPSSLSRVFVDVIGSPH